MLYLRPNYFLKHPRMAATKNFVASAEPAVDTSLRHFRTTKPTPPPPTPAPPFAALKDTEEVVHSLSAVLFTRQVVLLLYSLCLSGRAGPLA